MLLVANWGSHRRVEYSQSIIYNIIISMEGTSTRVRPPCLCTILYMPVHNIYGKSAQTVLAMKEGCMCEIHQPHATYVRSYIVLL